jgi:preprotein translocase subunit SecB
MSETTPAPVAPATDAAPQGPVFGVEKLYVRNVSFESPGAPNSFNEASQPELALNLNQRAQPVNDVLWEVVLTVTLTCKVADKTLYLAEVEQAGLFAITGFDAGNTDALVGIQCPMVLYPFARQVISDLIQAGGFPPFPLQPLNFEAIYAESLHQRQLQAGGGNGGAGTPPGWPTETHGNA